MRRAAVHRNKWRGRRFCTAVHMDPHNGVTARILASLAALPECGQAEAIRAAIGRAIKEMSIYRVLELRLRVRAEFDCDNPVVRSTLDMIDGQVALREIAGGAGWR